MFCNSHYHLITGQRPQLMTSIKTTSFADDFNPIAWMSLFFWHWPYLLWRNTDSNYDYEVFKKNVLLFDKTANYLSVIVRISTISWLYKRRNCSNKYKRPSGANLIRFNHIYFNAWQTEVQTFFGWRRHKSKLEKRRKIASYRPWILLVL